MLRIRDAAVRSWVALFAEPILVSDVTQIGVPTLVVQGAETTAPERRLCEIVADRVPEARAVVVA